MSKYTTGEIAKLCGVTVRTVQYYDTRGILTPSDLTEGGRRLYSEDDLKLMKIICFLREIGLSIESISKLLKEEDPANVISLLLDQQRESLESEIDEREAKLQKLSELRSGLKNFKVLSIESIGDIAYIMNNRNELKRLHTAMLLTAIPFAILQLTSVALWITRGIWWPFIVWAVTIIPYGIWITRLYYKKVDYICPQCHTVFKPSFKEMFFAAHTPATRKLTCPGCGHRGFCVEAAGSAQKEGEGSSK